LFPENALSIQLEVCRSVCRHNVKAFDKETLQSPQN